MGAIAKPTPRRNSVIGADELNASSRIVIVSSATYRTAWRRPVLLFNIRRRQRLWLSGCARGEASARSGRISLGDEGPLHRAELLERLARPSCHARERVVRDVNRHLGRFAYAP